jgi:hypothetical protein
VSRRDAYNKNKKKEKGRKVILITQKGYKGNILFLNAYI